MSSLASLKSYQKLLGELHQVQQKISKHQEKRLKKNHAETMARLESQKEELKGNIERALADLGHYSSIGVSSEEEANMLAGMISDGKWSGAITAASGVGDAERKKIRMVNRNAKSN